MRKFYEEAECVFAWLGHLEGGDLAFCTVQSLQSEFDIQMAGERNVRTLTDVDAALHTVAMMVIEEIVSGSPEAVAKYKAVDNMFRSEPWGRLWIWQELIVAKRVHLEWATHSAELESLKTTFGILQYLLFSEWPRASTKIQNVLTGNPPNEPKTKIAEIFKIRTRRRIWQEHKVIRLDRLLDTARWAYSSDPRDRVFALSGLGDPQLRNVPDYKASIRSVYISTVAVIMAQGCSLDILAYCKHSGTAKSADLPTWCPDWSTESHAIRIPLLSGDFPELCPFQASRHRPGVFRVVPDPLQVEVWTHMSLFTTGLSIGTVQRIGSFATDHKKTDEERFQDLLVLWASLIANERMLGDEVFQELEKTAVLENRGRHHVFPNMSLHSIRKNNYQNFQHNAVYGDRRFFVTSNGLMGIAPPHVEEGDIACVLLGAQLPFLLRKDKDSGFYTLVGEVYISNEYMYGRAIDEMEAGTIQSQEFEIR
ncbi:hypothetical protein V8E51_016350 [Hyaloscypha variabilis]